MIEREKKTHQLDQGESSLPARSERQKSAHNELSRRQMVHGEALEVDDHETASDEETDSVHHVSCDHDGEGVIEAVALDEKPTERRADSSDGDGRYYWRSETTSVRARPF
jgi:hypothetical protein